MVHTPGHLGLAFPKRSGDGTGLEGGLAQPHQVGEVGPECVPRPPEVFGLFHVEAENEGSLANPKPAPGVGAAFPQVNGAADSYEIQATEGPFGSAAFWKAGKKDVGKRPDDQFSIFWLFSSGIDFGSNLMAFLRSKIFSGLSGSMPRMN